MWKMSVCREIEADGEGLHAGTSARPSVRSAGSGMSWISNTTVRAFDDRAQQTVGNRDRRDTLRATSSGNSRAVSG